VKHKAWVWHIRQLYDHKVRHIRLTVIQPQSPTHQTDSYTTTKSDTSDWQLYNHKVRHIRLTVIQPQSPTHQTNSYTTTKSDTSDWQLYNHKVGHIRLTVTRPQSRPQTKFFTRGLWTRRKIGSEHFHCENWGKFIYMAGSKLGNCRC